MRRRKYPLPMLALTLVLLAAAALTNVAAQEAEPPPTEEQPVPEANQAMVRFLHAAPNAQVDRVILEGESGTVEPEAFAGLSFGEMSDYVPVLVDRYEVGISVAGGGEEGALIEARTETVNPLVGEYYTIALVGLVNPEQAAEQEEGGFLEWLQGLFTSDDDAFAMRTLVINDGHTAGIRQDEAEVRIAHLAPGVDEVELVAVQEDGEANVLHTVGYGDVSGFGLVQPAAATLEIRAAGSEAVVLDVSDVDLSTGMGHTLFLIGTPVEQVPLELMVVSNPQALAGMPGAGLAVPPGAATFDASQVALFRDNFIQMEARLAAIEGHLANLSQVEGAQEEVSAAQAELEAARELLFASREQIEALPAVPSGAPTEPSAPAEPAEPADEEDAGEG